MLKLQGPEDALAELTGRALIGRSSRADVRIDDVLVSGEHAVVRWTGERWEVRDLGSRNGTFVDGRELDSGERVTLAHGMELAFGDSRAAWRVVDVRHPEPCARTPDGGLLRGSGELLALPSDDEPDVVVYAEDGAWLAERPDQEPEVVENGDLVGAGGACFVLLLPTEDSSTLTVAEVSPSVRRMTLRFRVSADEEHVKAQILGRGQVIDLGARSHHYLLLTLARARLTDRERGIDRREQGWVYQDDLAAGLRMSDGQIYLAVHRARRQLADHGVREARLIVERRRATRQLRLGVADVHVVSTADGVRGD